MINVGLIHQKKMEIKVFNEESIPKFKTDQTHITISFQDPGHEFVELPRQDSRIGWTGVKCYDFDQDTGHFPYDRFLFTRKHAWQILTLTETTKDYVKLICVNCVAGISRSAGCAAALSKIYNGNDSYFFKHYLPNMLVYRTILEEYNDSNNR